MLAFKKGGLIMDEFGYKKNYKVSRIINSLYPFGGLLGIAAYWFFLVEPGMGEFKWWVPLFACALFVWAIIDVVKIVNIFNFKVMLSDDTIKVLNDSVLWQNIDTVEYRNAWGEKAAVSILTKDGNTINLPAALDSYPYIKGVIESKIATSQLKIIQ
jgi:hypothetical protein